MLKIVSLSVALLLSIGLVGQALAGEHDLGGRWPNAVDVSASPYYHVYVFHRAGVKYIQVNDLAGTVRQAVASAGDQFLILPMGVDAARVTTPQQLASSDATTATSPQLVYRDEAISINVAVDSVGNLRWNTVYKPACSPPECSNVKLLQRIP